MQVVHSLDQLRSLLAELARDNTIGFVPTMGYLHEGHLALLKRSMAENHITVLSIYVNRKQFNETSDYEHYPRDDHRDLAMAQTAGVDIVWMPSEAEMYPGGDVFSIQEQMISSQMEGSFRPGHFVGVMTVMMKLLNQIKPQRVYMGEKDFQQAQLIKTMVAEFFMPVDVVICATVRDEHGLALSSRNARLTPKQRKQAAMIPRFMRESIDAEAAAASLGQHGFEVDYVNDYEGRRYAAARLNNVRLIDTLVINEEE